MPETDTFEQDLSDGMAMASSQLVVTFLMSAGAGSALVSGIQISNVRVGVQPALGVEGNPVRLLFDS